VHFSKDQSTEYKTTQYFRQPHFSRFLSFLPFLLYINLSFSAMASTDPNAEKQEPKVEQQEAASNVNMPNGMTLTVEELYDKDKFDLSTMEPGDVFQLLQYVLFSLSSHQRFHPFPSQNITARYNPLSLFVIFPAILFPMPACLPPSFIFSFLNYNQILFPLFTVPLIFCSFFFHLSLPLMNALFTN
jgi:hypothetical protein